MELYLIILAIVLISFIGILWDQRSLKSSTIDKNHEYEELDRLHLLLNGKSLINIKDSKSKNQYVSKEELIS
jgi:hypothetical protein